MANLRLNCREGERYKPKENEFYILRFLFSSNMLCGTSDDFLCLYICLKVFNIFGIEFLKVGVGAYYPHFNPDPPLLFYTRLRLLIGCEILCHFFPLNSEDGLPSSIPIASVQQQALLGGEWIYLPALFRLTQSLSVMPYALSFGVVCD